MTPANPVPNANVLNPHGAKDAVSRAAALAMQFATKGGAAKVCIWFKQRSSAAFASPVPVPDC